MLIAIDNRSERDLPLDQLEALAHFVLEHESAPPNTELSISLVTKDEIRELNRVYRAKDAATDVLSFECDSAYEHALGPALETLLLGDVIIAPEVADEHARDFNSNFAAEMDLILVHGILHLLGYDHDQNDEAEAMESRESALLALWSKTPHSQEPQ
jgi:probable rRNA maturation factor